MNHEAPKTLAAAQEQILELEQQLRLSDEGVSRLAERCLTLEQQLLNCQAALAKPGDINEPIVLILPYLFYDSGNGFSSGECLTVTEEVYNELTHEVSAVFVLPVDARALRLDPGELACCITDLSISDDRVRCRATNGTALREGSFLFMGTDPNLLLESPTGFSEGLKFAVTYHYYPLEHFLQEQPGRSLLQALNILKRQNERSTQEADELLQCSRREIAELRAQLAENQRVYEDTLCSLRQSHSWRLTAPLRAFTKLFHRSRSDAAQSRGE